MCASTAGSSLPGSLLPHELPKPQKQSVVAAGVAVGMVMMRKIVIIIVANTH